MTFWGRSKHLGTAMAGALCLLTLTACFGQTAAQTAATTQPASSPTGAAASGTASPATAATTPSASTPVPAGNSTPSASANATISPRTVSSGSVTLDLSLEPARHMFDGSAPASSAGTPAQSTPQASGNSGSSSASSAVFTGGMVGVSNNIDPSQAPPADSAQAVIRHVVVHVRTTKGSQPVPYLNLSLDLLLDGHPILYDQPLEPMTAVDKNPLQYYYGNNVKFPQPGTYQVFIRIQPNPMLGSTPPQAAQFNVILH